MTMTKLLEENAELINCLEDVANELLVYPGEVNKRDIEEYKKSLISKIDSLKEKATAYDTMTIGSKIDTMVYCLIGDMTGIDLWRKIFNKMTKPAKRQLVNELLNSCLGNGYCTKPYIFDKEDEDEK